jgi:acyl carrier protein
MTAQTPARMRAVAAAKVGGALELMTLPGIAAADFVVLYSSVASALGTRGQANYASANAILDAMAHSLRARGVRATSICFGPFAGIGLATEGRRLEILADSGLGGLRPVHADAALATVPRATHAHEIVAVLDASSWLAAHDQPSERVRFHELLGDTSAAGAPATSAPNGLRQQLAAIPGVRQRADLVLEFVQREIATVLRTGIERIEPQQALRSMGIDSLTSLELRNRLEQGTGLRLPGTLVFTYPNPSAIATYLMEQLSPTTRANAMSAPSPVTAPQMVDDELDALAREMSSLDDDAVRQLLAERGAGDGA